MATGPAVSGRRSFEPAGRMSPSAALDMERRPTRRGVAHRRRIQPSDLGTWVRCLNVAKQHLARWRRSAARFLGAFNAAGNRTSAHVDTNWPASPLEADTPHVACASRRLAVRRSRSRGDARHPPCPDSLGGPTSDNALSQLEIGLAWFCSTLVCGNVGKGCADALVAPPT